MKKSGELDSKTRYSVESEQKSNGATYTPKLLADFVAKQIVDATSEFPEDRPLRILDPAVGHGELLVSLGQCLISRLRPRIELYGFDTNPTALNVATERLKRTFPDVPAYFEVKSFLDFVGEYFNDSRCNGSLSQVNPPTYDLIIANPPYVRTQILGSRHAQLLASQFKLSGRVDLYHAFVLGMSLVLGPKGIAGIIVSNRFMTTKSGASVRGALIDRFNLRSAWDLGDTKLFSAAVLPAVLLVQNKDSSVLGCPTFTSIYETNEPASNKVPDVITALDSSGVVETQDGRHFKIQRGKLDTGGASDGVWRVSSTLSDAWLGKVEVNTWGTFRDVGKIRVGVKTCADKVFIRDDWDDMHESVRPELLRPLTTHHIANRFKPLVSSRAKMIVYPHEVVKGSRRAVDLADFPRTRTYLVSYRTTLENRRYLVDAGRNWYEIWVPRDPDLWHHPKLVFRDIALKPTFWIDFDGSVINGDCYWLSCSASSDLNILWLALAVANSTFVEQFYDLRFQNKLYAGRRRFMTQYVEQFPLPDPNKSISRDIVSMVKKIHHLTSASEELKSRQEKLDAMVWRAFLGDE